METETRKILGQLENGRVEPHPVSVSAHATRVPVINGHTGMLSVGFETAPSPDEMLTAFREFAGRPQAEELPTAPRQPIVYVTADDRPQPRLDVDRGAGMTVTVGRLRACHVPRLQARGACAQHGSRGRRRGDPQRGVDAAGRSTRLTRLSSGLYRLTQYRSPGGACREGRAGTFSWRGLRCPSCFLVPSCQPGALLRRPPLNRPIQAPSSRPTNRSHSRPRNRIGALASPSRVALSIRSAAGSRTALDLESDCRPEAPRANRTKSGSAILGRALVTTASEPVHRLALIASTWSSDDSISTSEKQREHGQLIRRVRG